MCSEKNRTIILYEIPGKIDFGGIDHNSDEPSLDNLSTTDKTHLTVKEKVFKQLKGSGIVCQLLKKAWQKMKGSDVPEDDEEGHDFYDYSELEELEQLPRYRPESLSALTRTTRFTEAEIKRIYRGFKAECPTGVVKEDTFKVIYSQFFPQGANTGPYAHYIFNSLDQSRSGLVSFEDFVQGLSILSRGTLDEKLLWTFSLYDINGDGHITREEMTEIVTAIYELVGRLPDTHVDEEIVREKVEKLFEKMDTNQDGVVTLDEFLYCCRNDNTISSSMTVFDTSI